jgi:methyl-accepting chemotaxis protein
MSGFTIGRKLGLGVASLGALLLVLGYTSLRAISNLGGALDTAIGSTAREVELIGSTQTAFQEMKQALLREQIAYVIQQLESRAEEAAAAAKESAKADGAAPNATAASGTEVPATASAAVPASAGEDTACSGCHAPSGLDDSIRAMEAGEQTVRRGTAELRLLVPEGAPRDAVTSIEAKASQWLADSRQYLAYAGSKQYREAHRTLKDDIFPILDEVDKSARVLSQQQREALAISGQQAQTTIKHSRWTAFLLIGVNLLVAGGVLLLVRRVIKSFRHTMAEMKAGSQQVAAAAGQVTAASQSLAQGASKQAASLQETSASSEEINSMARRNSENSHAAADLVAQSQSKFVETSQSLDQMVAAMDGISTQSGKISKIIKVIDEIAFQTNILALNAAVEAARAGEAGLGFAVVADEVRNLAQRCAQAAKDTAALIEESIARSGEGKVKVDQVAAAFRGIAAESAKVKTLVDEVNHGSLEQSRGIEQVAKAITQIEAVTQTNAASAEQSAAAAAELKGHSQMWNDIVARFESMVGGGQPAKAHGSGRNPRPVVAVPNVSLPRFESGVGGGQPAKAQGSGRNPRPEVVVPNVSLSRLESMVGGGQPAKAHGSGRNPRPEVVAPNVSRPGDGAPRGGVRIQNSRVRGVSRKP